MNKSIHFHYEQLNYLINTFFSSPTQGKIINFVEYRACGNYYKRESPTILCKFAHEGNNFSSFTVKAIV